MTVGVVAEEAVEQLEAIGAGGLHEPERAREALRIDRRPREPLRCVVLRCVVMWRDCDTMRF